ncbi:acyl-CoA N-acyltransferase [Blakeslea trispora]|nr:acyl-CoA N-acyltransferase [Blakeslea trispora]
MTIDTPKFVNIKISRLEGPYTRSIAVRYNVFVVEQGYHPKWQMDDLDHLGIHWIATADKVDENGVIVCPDVDIGTIRLMPKENGLVKLTRFAVIQEARGLRVGQGLVKVFVDYCQKHGYDTIVLHSQYPRRGFYQKVGFVLEKGDDSIFDEAGTPHVRLWMRNIQSQSL